MVTWELTQACELACDHCRADATPDRDPNELDISEGISLFEQIADFGDRTPMVVLSGGDPLERPDLFELLEGATEAGLTPAVTPATTPSLDRAQLEALSDAGVNRIAVSLDGASAKTHDSFRGEPGTFETAIRAARQAREAGLSIQVNTTVTAQTVSELPAIADLVEELGAAMWEVFFLVPVGRGVELEQLEPERAAAVTGWLYRQSRDAPYRLITVEAPFYRRVANEMREPDEGSVTVGTTGAGNGFVFVSATGDVYPSGFMPLSAGNVREESLVSIYRESDLMQQLRDRSSFDGPCGECPATESCGGSRSRAYAATGNPTGSDPLCPWAVSDHEYRFEPTDPFAETTKTSSRS
ncbi:radical SAM protein [Natronobacterium gregoryi SP2]|uniref:Radical SAM domain protein n=1 Tax=Natronobacterium gregoryi (strain ATCC 43098 / DSM 3393 / CCM 3738 / CIP 104747 / IAM 13177 / JCM 8860 / NBRC 102187 / NCIMB 2189 / SP2) TaxID=797304 RepID=L9YLS8_NATGS|nr:Radical SAM domain protein [Natronobacterium gregoryi SP2]PLK19897.1 radical SAM protein [Natronobacterium gregoryi SP2]